MAIVQFFKLWTALRLAKRSESVLGFIFLYYSDTFVTHIYDNVFAQYRETKSAYEKIGEKDLENIPLEGNKKETSL